jgi:hypothetical protein
MLRVGFEPTTPAFERGKTVDGSDRTATVIGDRSATDHKFCIDKKGKAIPVTDLGGP